MGVNGFTTTQKALLNLLSDGEPHKRQELMDVLGDELASRNALQCQLQLIRGKIKPAQNIVCVLRNRTIHYQWVALLSHRN